MELTPKHQRAIDLLLTGASITETARQLRVARMTVQRWLGEPGFCAELSAQRRAILQGSADKLASKVDHAIDLLDAMVADTSLAPAVRIAGIRLILESAWKAFETTDLAAQIAQLDARLAEHKP